MFERLSLTLLKLLYFHAYHKSRTSYLLEFSLSPEIGERDSVKLVLHGALHVQPNRHLCFINFD